MVQAKGFTTSEARHIYSWAWWPIRGTIFFKLGSSSYFKIKPIPSFASTITNSTHKIGGKNSNILCHCIYRKKEKERKYG